MRDNVVKLNLKCREPVHCDWEADLSCTPGRDTEWMTQVIADLIVYSEQCNLPEVAAELRFSQQRISHFLKSRREGSE